MTDVVDHRDLIVDQIIAVNEKIDALTSRRAMLKERLIESTIVAGAAFRREEPTRDEIVEWIADATKRGERARITGIPTAARKGVGLTQGELQKMRWDLRHAWPPDQTHGGGVCDSDDHMPRSGPVIYALYDCLGRMSYVGRTINFRQRLNSHRNEKGPLTVHRWEVWICDTEEQMCDLEAILIEQHRPRLNKRQEKRNGAAA